MNPCMSVSCDVGGGVEVMSVVVEVVMEVVMCWWVLGDGDVTKVEVSEGAGCTAIEAFNINSLALELEVRE